MTNPQNPLPQKKYRPKSVWLDALDIEDRYSDLDHFAAYIKRDFEHWLWEVTEIKLYSYQKEIAFAVLDSLVRAAMRELVGEMARQMGKTLMAAALLSYCAVRFPELGDESLELAPNSQIAKNMGRYRKGFKAGIFAPGERQATFAYDHTRDTLRKYQSKCNKPINMDRANRFVTDRGSEIRLFTASPNASIEGYTTDIQLCDESQSITDAMLIKSVFPMNAHTRGTRLLIGTPSLSLMLKGQKCRYFFDALHNPKRADDRFIFDYRVGMSQSDDYKAHIEAELKRTNINEPYFQCSYALRWMVEQIGFIDSEKIAHIEMLSKERGIVPIKQAIKDANADFLFRTDLFFSCDTAQAPDDTACLIAQLRMNEERNLPEIIIYDMFLISGGVPYIKQAETIYQVLSRYAINTMTIDATGSGTRVLGSALSQLIEEKVRTGNLPHHRNMRIKPIVFNAFNHHHMFTKLHELIHNDQILWAVQDNITYYTFKKELEMLGMEFKNGNLMSCHHPQDEHDDFCSALALLMEAIGIDFLNPKMVNMVSNTTHRTYYSGGDRTPSWMSGETAIPGLSEKTLDFS